MAPGTWRQAIERRRLQAALLTFDVNTGPLIGPVLPNAASQLNSCCRSSIPTV